MLRGYGNVYDVIRKVYGIEDPCTPRYTLRVQDLDRFREKFTKLVSDTITETGLDIEKQAHAMRMRESNIHRWLDETTTSRPAKYNLVKICQFYKLDTPEKMKDAGIELVRMHTLYLSDDDIAAISDLRDSLALKHPAVRGLTRVVGKFVD